MQGGIWEIRLLNNNPEPQPVADKGRVTVIGCGVIGLTTGIRLLEAGYSVTIIARDIPPATTSNVAAAVWFPYHVNPLDRVLKWSQASLDVYYHLSTDMETGISISTFIDLYDTPVPDPWWCEAVRQFRRPLPHELPTGYGDGHVAEVPLIETPVFMDWLVRRFLAHGGWIKQREVTDLREESAQGGMVVNCSGLGARVLAADNEVFPVRGQIARVTRPASINRVIFDEHGHNALAYVIPRRREVIVGGTAKVGDWNIRVDPQTATEILAKGVALAPELAESSVIEHLVGLRPGRSAVRLEVEHTDRRGTIIHNYGHGGAGFTLAWGCAAEVVTLVRTVGIK